MASAVKMTGADLKRFYNDDALWVDGMFQEDAEIHINGKQASDTLDADKVDNAAAVEIRGGDVMSGEGDYVCSLPELAQRWFDAQTHTIVTVKIEKSKLEALRAAVKAAGGEIQ